MKRLFVAVLVLTTGSAWALPGTVKRQLERLHGDVQRILADSRWLHADMETYGLNERDFFNISRELDTLGFFVDEQDPQLNAITKLMERKFVFPMTTEKQVNQDQLNAFRQLERDLQAILRPGPDQLNPEHVKWRDAKHGQALLKLDQALHEQLNKFTSMANGGTKVTVSDLEQNIQSWIDRAYFLTDMSQDAYLKTYLVRVGRTLDDRKATVPTMVHVDADLVQYRAVLTKAVLEMDEILRTLDRNGLNCSLDLRVSSPIPRGLQ